MRYFIIASHGNLSESLLQSAEMVLGKQERVSCIVVEISDGPEILENKIEKAFRSIKDPDAEIIVLTDVLGGGITNLIIQRIPKCHFRLIAGMNLPLLLELFTLEEEKITEEQITEEQITEIIVQARLSIVDVGKMIEERRIQNI